MDTNSLWEHISTVPKKYPELTENLEVDVVIVGGGITGITAALQLISAGKKVALLEANQIGGGTTGFSTGNLYIPIQPYYHKVLNKFDKETVKIVAESRKNAIDYIENTVKAQNIPCNFTRRPMYFYANKNHEIDFLKREVEILKECSIDVDYIDSLPLSLEFQKAALIKNQARFNPLQYVRSLAEYLSSKGCLIFENSRVMEIKERNDICIFKTNKAKITAKKAIIATHTPTGVNPIQLFTAPYRSYVVAVQLEENIYPEINYWNLETPHYAISTHSMSKDKADLLVIAGSHHKTGQSNNAQSHYDELENYLREKFQVKELKFRWSAQHYHSADGIPYIGLAYHYKNIYEATGFFADGLVYGTISGIVLADSLLNKKNDWQKTYNTKRHKFFASFNFLIKENFNTFLQYMKDFPKFSSQEYKKTKKGEGRICVLNGEKCGVYRDENEKLHIVSAVCTHMKCIVNWNNAEKTWDCPCHGSRFTYEGKVIEGPARIHLTQKNVES